MWQVNFIHQAPASSKLSTPKHTCGLRRPERLPVQFTTSTRQHAQRTNLKAATEDEVGLRRLSSFSMLLAVTSKHLHILVSRWTLMHPMKKANGRSSLILVELESL